VAPARTDENGTLSVVFLDVGQGDATLIRFPSGRAWLVDAGGIPGARTFDVGARVVAPALWAMGVRRVETLAVTHGDPDHAGGAAAIVADFAPSEVWEGIPVPGEPLMQQVAAAARAAGAARRVTLQGTTVVVDDVEVRVVHPAAPDWERRRVRNDDSLTLVLTYGGTRVLLTGDIGTAVEGGVSRALGPSAAWITVLKVPHHGSAGSSSQAFLEAVRPTLAVASAGAGNRFGHPAREVVARYAALGIPLYRTDRDGAVAVGLSHAAAAVHTWDGQAWRLAWRASRAPRD
jgi:competence protein ComEC